MARILVLGCGIGGSSAGYAAAGFDVLGVDLAPQPLYPFTFEQGDMLTYPFDGFGAVHASPPCQRWSAITRVNGTQDGHPDLIGPMRARLIASGKPYVIENVPRSPLVDPVTLCGATLCPSIVDRGLVVRLSRHRLFESNLPLQGCDCTCRNPARRDVVYGVYGGGTRQDTRVRRNPSGGNTQKATRDQARLLMEMPWATRVGMNQAIPPAYTEFLGRQIMALL